MFDDLIPHLTNPIPRKQLKGWAALAISSLALAGLFALLLALSRVPGIQDVFPWPLDFFHKGLVIHVVFSFVVWFLAVFGALLHLATLRLSGGTPRFDFLGRAALLLTAAAFVLLLVPSLMDRGEPSLNNYVPVIIDPLYYYGLDLLFLGIALAVLRLIANLGGGVSLRDPLILGTVSGSIIYLLAMFALLYAANQLWGQELSEGFNEDLFWGSGHILQFLNVAMMLLGWALLAGITLGGNGPSGGALIGNGVYRAAAWLLLVSALPAPFFYAVFEPFSADQILAFTDLQYALAPPTILVAGAAVLGYLRLSGQGLDKKHPGLHCLMLSIAVFGAGGFLGLFVDGADTRTPAHYHGVIAGINLVFMGLFFTLFLPLLGRAVRRGKALYAQIWMFGVGQLIASIGLFWAGGFGAPRKTAGAAQGLEDFGAIAGMAMNGIGGLIAVIGGLIFIWTVGRALWLPPAADNSTGESPA